MAVRMHLVYVSVGEPDTSACETCPGCGFDSLLTFPLTSLTESGVGPMGVYRACGRCYQERDSN